MILVRLVLAGLVALIAAPAAADHPTRYTAVTSPGGIVFHHRFDDITPYASATFGWAATRDQRGQEGLRALLPGLLFNGVYAKTPFEYYEQLADLHATVSVAFSETQVTAETRAPGKQLGPALELLLKALRNGNPSANTLRRSRTNAISAEAQGQVSGSTQVSRAAALMLLGDHPVTRSFDPGRFDTVKLADVATWRKTAFTEGKLHVVVSGRISADAAGRIVDTAFATWPKAASPAKPKPALITARPTSITLPTSDRQSVVQLQAPTIAILPREVRIASLAHGVFGSGASGRLFMAVRGDLGATYGASSTLSRIGPDQYRVVMSAAVDPAQTEASVAALKRAYAAWYAGGITDVELTTQRERMLTAHASMFRDPASANRQVLAILVADRPLADLDGYESSLNALTRDEVNTFIKARFPKPDDFMVVVGTPAGTTFAAACTAKTFADVRKTCAAQ